MSDKIELLVEATDNASSVLGGIGKALGGIGDIAKGVFVGGILGKGLDLLGGAISGVKDAMIGGNAEFERYQTQFGVLMGGADKAKERLNMLAEFGAKTPFELPELVKADKVLLSFGLHSDTTAKKFGVSGEQILTTIGDIAAGTGVGFEELSLTFGKFASGATGEAIARFQELGIATREQMASWGLEFSKSGQLLTPVDKAFGILEQNVRKKFGGMMDAQSQTFEGMVSNFQDWLGQVGRMLGAPIFDALKENLGGLLAFLGSDSVKGAISGMAAGVATGIKQVIDFLKSMQPTFESVGYFIEGFVFAITGASQAIEPFSDTLGELASNAGFGSLGSDIAFITEVIGLFIQSVVIGGGSLGEFAGVLDEIGYSGSNLGQILSAAFTFIDTAITQAFAGENLDAANIFLYALEDMGIQVPAFINEIAFGIEAGLNQIPDAINKTVDSFYTIALAITDFGAGIVPTLGGILESVASIFGSLIPIALTSGLGAWTMISTTIQTVITSAIAILQTWLPVVQTVLAGIAAFLAQHGAEIQLLVSTAWNAITTIIQTAITTATTVINAFAPVVLAIFGEISAFLNANGADILATITSVWESVGAIIKTVSEIVKATVIPAFAAIAGFIKDHGAEIQAVLSGAWAVIKTVVTSAIDTIKGVLNLGLAIIRGDWGAAWKEIQGITETSNNLIKTVINTAMTLIEGVIKLAVDNFKRGWEMGWQLMQTATDTAMTLIKDAINTGIERAKTVIADGVEAFLGKFRDLRDKMSVIGQQLLEGMVQGIRDKVGWLVDEAVRASNAVLSAIKSTLGIHSPSDETIDVAAYLMKGGAIGVKENAYLWVDASKNVANDLIYTFDSGLGTVLTNSQSAFERIAQTVTPIVQLADTADFVMGRIENSAQSMTSAVSASMAAAGNSISTTAGQLAQFVQSGGVGGITGGIYTPSAAFQALFTNPPPAPIIAPPRPASVPKGDTINNTPISITINSDKVDRYAVEDGVMSALRRSGLGGRYA